MTLANTLWVVMVSTTILPMMLINVGNLLNNK